MKDWNIDVNVFNTFFNDKWDNNHGDNRNNNVNVFTGIGNNINVYIVEVFIQIMMIKINILYISMIL